MVTEKKQQQSGSQITPATHSQNALSQSSQHQQAASAFQVAPQQQMDPSKIWCKDRYFCEQINDRSHTSMYLHACRFGKSCRDIRDPYHNSRFYHFKCKPDCKYGNCCTQLTDPRHRAYYHHPGLWDYMELCKYGKSCRKINDKDHHLKYSHENELVYPQIK